MAGNADLFKKIVVICLIFAGGWASMVVGLFVIADFGFLNPGYLALGSALGALGTLIAYFALRRWRALVRAEPVALAGRQSLLNWLLAPILIIGFLFILWTAVDVSLPVIGLIVLAGALFAAALYLWKSTPPGNPDPS